MMLATSPRKAAAMLVALGPERAASVLRSFDDDEVRVLAAEVASIGSVPPQEVANLLGELATEVVGRRSAAEGGVRFAHDLLARALGPERATTMMSDLDGVEVPFVYLAEADADLAARALAPEPPAGVALALAHLQPDASARILVELPPAVGAEVAVRLAALERVHPDVVAQVDADFRRRLAPVLEERVTPIAGLAHLVDMLNRSSRETERSVLEAVEAQDPDLASRIRDALFTFDDIARLDDRSIQQVLKSVDGKDLATALKNGSPGVTECVLRNLSERARANLVEEIEFLKGVNASDIEAARTRVVRAVRALEEAGTITIERGGEDDGGR